mgnify:FL=1
MSHSVKKMVLEANQWIVSTGLVSLTWGNVSALSTDRQRVIIKPSGIDLKTATPEDMSELSLSENYISGKKPSVDTPTHVCLYHNFKNIGSVVHTHSKYATIWAQAYKNIPCFGTTHADYFDGSVPCIRPPTPKKVKDNYETYTGYCIVEYFEDKKIDPLRVPGALIGGHGVFCWGETVEKALENAFVLEKVAEMAYHTRLLGHKRSLPKYILRKHFDRKHGDKKYYGQ